MEYKINKILFPTDFSNSFKSALDTAVALSRKTGATVTLLNVFEVKNNIEQAEIKPLYRTSQNNSIIIREEKIFEMARILTIQYNIKVNWKVLTGNVAESICKVSDDEKCDLVIMGTRINSKFHKKENTSIAFKVIQNSLCPVITVPESWDKNYFHRIIYPVRILPVTLLKYDYLKPVIDENKAEIIITGIW